jgi:hypothetical protein
MEIEAREIVRRETAARLVLCICHSLSLEEPEFAKNATRESKISDSMHGD